MAPLRIVRILTRLNIGGPAIHVALLTHRMAQDRFSTCLVVGRPEQGEGNRIDWVRTGPGKVVELRWLRRGIHPLRDWVAWIRLLRVLWHEKPHVVHTHTAKAGTLGRLAGLAYNRIGPGRKFGQRALLVHTFHGHVLEGYFPIWASGLFTGIERWLARRTDCLVAVSPAIRRDLLKRGIGREEQWEVIPLGLELSALERLAPPDRNGALRCGLIGRLVPIKNPALFLEAVERVTRNHSASFLQAVIIGDGPLRPQLEAEVRARRLEETVSFTGWRDDLASCYQSLDVVCLTSWNEGTPLSLIEGMAAGRIAVASDVGGVRDLLEPPADCGPEIPAGRFQLCSRGILFRPGDARGLADALETLAREPALREKLSGAGRSHALATFGPQRLIEEISHLYERAGQTIHGGRT